MPTCGNLWYRPSPSAGETEAVGADDRPVLDDHPVAEAAPLPDLHPGVQDAVLTHLDTLGEHDVGVDDGARPDPDPGPDDRQRAHVDVLPQVAVGSTWAAGSIPGAVRGAGCSSATARAKVR